MNEEFAFPFGQKVHRVEQTDRTQKKVFVLGVYASAVHATWRLPRGVILVRALAVASEPCIFWRGEGAQEIVEQISVPQGIGSLIAAGERFNGPSGRILDERFLGPLGVDRSTAWLCDLLPRTCLNQGQLNAIQKQYDPKRLKYSLPAVTIPKVPTQFSEERRRGEILSEIRSCDPKLILLLGDQPIKWFLHDFTGHSRLTDFGATRRDYGKIHRLSLEGKTYDVLPLVHPRQAGGLGTHSSDWTSAHSSWMKHKASEIGQLYNQDQRTGIKL